METLSIKTLSDISTMDRSEVHQLASPNQNFGLSKIEFENIVSQLKQGNESLFEKIFLSHFEECSSFLKKNFKAPCEIAYDITMDTLIEFRFKLLTDKITYGNLRYLFTKMAGQFYLKSIAKDNRIKEAIIPLSDEVDEYEDKLIALKNAWKSLSNEDKKLLENYYYLDIPLNKMAELGDKSDAALRKQKQRAVDKLRQIFFKNFNNL